MAPFTLVGLLSCKDFGASTKDAATGSPRELDAALDRGSAEPGAAGGNMGGADARPGGGRGEDDTDSATGGVGSGGAPAASGGTSGAAGQASSSAGVTGGGGAAGGTSRTGGMNAGGATTGGTIGSGGAGTGGMGSGGAATGGMTGSGGAGTGGMGSGGVATGGATTGGAQATGGATSGGAPASGGAPGTGGAPSVPLSIEFVRTKSSADAIAFKQVRPTCPAGKRALAASWAVESEATALMEGRSSYFYPGYDGANWLINAAPRLPGTTWLLDSSVACVSELPGYEVVTASSAADTTATKSISVSCPAGKVSVGAGWADLDSTDAISDGELLQFQVSAAGTTWTAKVTNMLAAVPTWKISARAICVPSGSVPGYEVVTVTSPSSAAARQLRGVCPGSKRALFGGWAMLNSGNTVVDGQSLYSTYNGNEWLFLGGPAQATTSVLQGRVICID